MRPHQQDLISLRSSLVFLAFAIVVFGFSGPSARSYGADAASRKFNFNNFNKTIREIQRRKEILKRMEQEVMPKMGSTKNGPVTPWLGNVKAPILPAHGTGQSIPQPDMKAGMNNIIQPVGIVPINHAHGTGNLMPPPQITERSSLSTNLDNIIKPSSIEKNMLSFLIDSDVINGNRKPVSGLKLFVYVWKREPKMKAKDSRRPSNLKSTRDLSERSRKRNGRRNMTIKIRVFMSNKDGVKGKRIAELKKEISQSKFQTIPLPISLIKNISQDPDKDTGSMHIRVECSRCSRKTRLILPGNDKKRCRKRRKSKSRRDVGASTSSSRGDKKKEKDGSVKDKVKSKRKSRRRRRRRYCAKMRTLEASKLRPFIVIMDDDLMPHSSRPKRSADLPALCTTNSQHTTQPDDNSGKNSTSNANSTSTPETKYCCDKLETFVSFSDLNLDTEIVSPSGFHFTTCSATKCGIHSRQNVHKNDQILEELRHKIRSFLSSPSPSSPQTQKINPISNLKYKPGKIWNILNRSRLKQMPSHHHAPTVHTPHCSPSSKTDLTLLHLKEDSSLVNIVLPGFIVTGCQCKKL